VPLAAAATAAAAPAPPPAAGSNGGSGSNDGSSGGSRRQGVLTEAEAAHILGSQANLWTEYVADEATAEYMLLPRLAALAEAVW
jgi:hexosaminidase